MKKIIFLLCVMALVFTSKANSPYISKVFNFLPAPGQFVNAMPEYEEGDTKANILAKVEEQICGNDDDGATPGMISLGAWGGYVVFGFDHPVVNVRGEYDFKIYGNAFKATQASDGGSCEPGIVMVSYDENGNGEPDDKWFEIAGSEYGKTTTIQDYKLTYYRTPVDHVAVPDEKDKHIIDNHYIRWEDNKGQTGYVTKNVFNSQSYWPEWLEGDSLIFYGTRLPDNAEDQSGNGTYYVLTFFEYGYVDNQPNTEDPGFKIEWAVDENGNSVNLPAIHFIKIYNAMNQNCGWLGETSTEVCGGEDLHPNAVYSGIKDIQTDDNNQIEYYNLYGIKIEKPENGIFIVRKGNETYKANFR